MRHEIDTSGWKEFLLGDLFDISKGRRLTKANMIEGNTNFIGSSSVNNGITAHVGNTEHVNDGGALTVCYNGSVGETFYQDDPFLASDDVNIIRPKCPVSKEALLFAGVVIRKFGQSYNWTDKWSRDVMLDTPVMLPATLSGDPDWAYMDAYMSGILTEEQAYADELNSQKWHSHSIDSGAWRKYRIGDLFDIRKGTRLTRADMKPGTTPFIGATLENNGITAFVGNDEHIHPGNTITVAYNGQKATGKAFWQPVPFWASDDVSVLYPKFEMTRNIALFLSPIFWEAGRPYAFADKWRIELMRENCLMLPATPWGKPDWDYMDSFMGRLMEESEASCSSLDTDK